MDAKQILLKETFEDEFKMERFVRWTIEFFNKVKIIAPNTNIINYFSEFRFHIISYSLVADFTDADRNKIAVYAVELERGRNAEKARSKQRNFISKLISGSAQYDAAIAAFYIKDEPRWRLSLVRLDKQFLAGGKVKTSITPAKRFSYLVGKGEPSRTAMDQLFPIFQSEDFNPTLDKIEEAFSVETVTKEFFDRYRDKYYELKDFLDKNEQFKDEATTHGFTSEQFAKKLMGQLAFLYFLQKKGWLGVKVVPPTLDEKKYKNAYYTNKASRDIIPKVYKQTNIDEYRIQPSVLLGKDFTDSDADVLAGCFEADSWNSGDKNFIRYIFNDSFKKGKLFFDDYLEPFFYEGLRVNRGKNHYYKRFNCKIPFLNGGLFDPIENYEWDRVRFEIPNEMFSNRHIKGDRDADGILDIFERYNFTMNEDEPLEREVAVDPEMLGKIFENLLDAKDRKSKGAFYTPREIVHYMCQESLINYLVNEVNLPYEDVKDFILFGEIRKDEDCSKNVDLEDDEKRSLPRNIYDSLSNIDVALVNIRVADPAVGSGAFPLGMLSEIVKLRNIITEYRAHQIPADKKFERKLEYHNRSPYRIKLETIRNCIFAVDIESSAVDIAKLRLWLSLVVDQEVNFDKDDIFFTNEDKDPHPLPNLDYNIMCGNSLIDEFEGIKLIDDDLFDTDKKMNRKESFIEKQMSLFNNQIDILTNRLFAEQEKFFAENDSARKNEIKTNINYILDAIIKAKLSGNNNEAGLARYEANFKEKTKPYFLWKLEFAKVFKEKGGFDVVIGNPPYIDSENMVNNKMEEFRNYVTNSYKFARGNWDIYIAFFEKSFNILSSNGSLCFITPDKWISKPFGNEMRKFLLYNIISILVAGRSVFENALVDSIITLISKKECTNINVLEMKTKKSPIKLLRCVDKKTLNSPFTLDIIFSNSINLINKLESTNNILSSLFVCENACATSDCYKLKDILYSLKCEDEFSKEKHMKIINTGTISKFYYRWGTQPMKYLKDKYQFPVVDKLTFFEMFPNSYGQKSIKPKIIIKGLTLLDGCIDLSGIIIPGKSTMMIPCSDENELKYLSVIINSKLMMFFIKQKYSSSSYNGGINFTKDMINNLPLKHIDDEIKKIFISIVDQILTVKQSDPTTDTSALEAEIDKMVYELYGLTEEEIKIVEGV